MSPGANEGTARFYKNARTVGLVRRSQLRCNRVFLNFGNLPKIGLCTYFYFKGPTYSTRFSKMLN